MGHSYGADTTISLARKLNDNKIPVALIVNFDPTSPDLVPPNVRRIINFYVPTAWGRPVEAASSSAAACPTSTKAASTTTSSSTRPTPSIARRSRQYFRRSARRRSSRQAACQADQVSAAPAQ